MNVKVFQEGNVKVSKNGNYLYLFSFGKTSTKFICRIEFSSFTVAHNSDNNNLLIKLHNSEGIIFASVIADILYDTDELTTTQIEKNKICVEKLNCFSSFSSSNLFCLKCDFNDNCKAKGQKVI